eukprot:CAMPEP_0119334450 /NCGR_PEP_ID=MMETSP1333-20130426/87350_1 /TAXON_ID=418940 /ORGANISM="Scyphosphaera apsteinii, Strain RCC1455" /LENGTH=264 /DNA_ID=CAMNT_0007344745 /DNA_START=262 /DNA_END=1056 /DNA_ORIENTATION=+
MYSLMSLNEYATHRYFQHLDFNRKDALPFIKRTYRILTGASANPIIKGDGHVEHHAETFDDMSLKYSDRWQRTPASKLLDADDFRGTAFHWHATGIMTIQMLPSVLPTYCLMGWSVPDTLALLLPCMLLHALVWNAIHPPMHGLPPVPLHVGAPSFVLAGVLAETEYFKYIFENHMGHHVLGGQVNYNVCCPGTDHLLGTYVPTEVWLDRMRPLPANAKTRGAIVGFHGMPVPPVCEADIVASAPAAITVRGGGGVLADAYSEE